jgi:serine/threonine-protein kinase
MSIEEARKQEPVIFQLKDGDRLGLSTKTELEIKIDKGEFPARTFMETQNDASLSDPLVLLDRMLSRAREDKKGAPGIKGYRKIKELGKGGMGTVWLVEEEATGKQAALKLILPEMEADEGAKELFLREAMIGGQLVHKNIIRQYRCGSDGGVFFILQEACMGGSVENLLDRTDGHRLPVEIAADIILQVLDGLEYAHNAPVTVTLADGKEQCFTGIVHRDIKPANIFIAEETSKYSPGHIRIADFGLAKAFEAAGLTNISGTESKGTPVFMPRQQIINCRYAKPDVDLWAVAATFYFMLTGQFPKPIRSPRTMWQDVLRNPAVPIRDHDSSIDKGLAGVIDRALVDNPDIGFRSAAELRNALAGALEDL